MLVDEHAEEVFEHWDGFATRMDGSFGGGVVAVGDDCGDRDVASR